MIAHKGQIVDATFIEAPKQRNPKDENELIKANRVPVKWTKNKRVQKDTAARWTIKGNERHYGYKNHIADAATTLAFILKYNLQDDFKLNLEGNHATLAGHTFEHELTVARINGALGSIDANQGDVLLGWDTDEFPTNVFDTTLVMIEILENNGIAPGGINFDSKVRWSSFAPEDLFLAHIAGFDTYARGLKGAAAIRADKFLSDLKVKRYASYQTGIGANIMADKEDLESLTEYSLQHGADITNESSHIELVKSHLNDYLV